MDPAVIEDALLAHPAVTGASAVGRPDPHSGGVPVAYVPLAPGTTDTGPDELIAFAAQHVSERAAAPKDVVVLSALPLTDRGKPSRVPLHLDSTRRAVSSALADIGFAYADEQIRCALTDGHPMCPCLRSPPGPAPPDRRPTRPLRRGLGVRRRRRVVRPACPHHSRTRRVAAVPPSQAGAWISWAAAKAERRRRRLPRQVPPRPPRLPPLPRRIHAPPTRLRRTRRPLHRSCRRTRSANSRRWCRRPHGVAPGRSRPGWGPLPR